MTPITCDVVRTALRHDRARHVQALGRLYGRTRATTKAQEGHTNAIADIDAAMAEVDLEADRSAAIFELLDVLVSWDGLGPQGHFTCSEAETFHKLLVAFGRSTAAAVFLAVHAEADGETEANHPSLRRSA